MPERVMWLRNWAVDRGWGTPRSMAEKAWTAMDRLLAETWMLSVLLVRIQKEVRNTFLEIRGKAILIK